MHLSAPASPSAAHSILEKVHCVRLCSHPHPCPTPLTPCAQTAPTHPTWPYTCVFADRCWHVRWLMGGRARHLLGRKNGVGVLGRVLQLKRGLPGSGHATHCANRTWCLTIHPPNAPFGVWVGGVDVYACAKQTAVQLSTVKMLL